MNPNTRTLEFSLRDPDGYYVTISAFSSLELGGHEPIESLAGRAAGTMQWQKAVEEK